jgi:hypothetical protein
MPNRLHWHYRMWHCRMWHCRMLLLLPANTQMVASSAMHAVRYDMAAACVAASQAAEH